MLKNTINSSILNLLCEGESDLKTPLGLAINLGDFNADKSKIRAALQYISLTYGIQFKTKTVFDGTLHVTLIGGDIDAITSVKDENLSTTKITINSDTSHRVNILLDKVDGGTVTMTRRELVDLAIKELEDKFDMLGEL